MSGRSHRQLVFTLLLLVIAIAVLGVVPARADAPFERADPSPGSVLARAPERVDIFVTHATSADPGATQILVIDRDQRSVDIGTATVDPVDHRHAWVGLRPGLSAGRYIVLFKTRAEQAGDVDGGTFAFYVQTQPTAAERVADRDLTLTTLDRSTDLRGYRRGIIEGGLGLVLGLPAAVYLWQRRQRTRSAPASPQDEGP